MDDFVKVIKRDPQLQIEIKDMLNKYSRLLYKYQPEIRN